MTLPQTILQRVLPRSLFDALRRGTHRWLLECPCGHLRDLWDAGGVKGGGTKEVTLKKCPACSRWRWHKKRHKTTAELARFPIEESLPDVKGTHVFTSQRDTWATALVWGSAILMWGSGVIVWLLSSNSTEDLIALSLALPGGLIAPWFWATTSYRLSRSELLLLSGCFSKSLPLAQIREVRPLRGAGVAVSYAFSLDTLLIVVNGARFGYRISPAMRNVFLETLAERCPHLQRQGETLLSATAPTRLQA